MVSLATRERERTQVPVAGSIIQRTRELKINLLRAKPICTT